MKVTSTQKPSVLVSSIALIIGIICICASAFGLFWLSKIIPGLYTLISENDYSFLKHTIIFHLLWLIFFFSLLMTGVKLIYSAINKKTTDLVPGTTLYFLGASLVVIGLFYLVTGEMVFAGISLIAGLLCIYFEGAYEIT